METHAAATLFATLGHPGRLAVFRLLMRFAPQGVRPTEIAEALGMKQNTLSHHLADLAACGLVRTIRAGRSLHYSVNLEATEAMVAYLALNLGRARPELVSPLLTHQGPKAHPVAPFNVLFLCSANSARSIFAEVLLRDLGEGRFRAYSAGTRPATQPNPLAIEVLQRNGHEVSDLQSKAVATFQAEEAPVMDFVFTVCDTAAAEECPPWPGQPITGHWGLPDPAKATGTDAEKALAFAETYAALHRRIAAFVELPFDALSRLTLQARVDAIGCAGDADRKG